MLFGYFISLLLGFLFPASDIVSYKGYKVFKINPKSSDDLNFLEQIIHDSESSGINVWRMENVVNGPAEVMVPPNKLTKFIDSLKKKNIKFQEFISDVEKTIQNEREQVAGCPCEDCVNEICFKKYYRYDEIVRHLENFRTKYPSRVELVPAATSHEGRSIYLFRIKPKVSVANPLSIIVDAAMHAREWIAPATALYVIKQLLEPGEPRANDDLLDGINFLFLPVVNPDGYEYTHTTDRFWRKNRRRAGLCTGVDVNRNFDHHWNAHGSAKFSCLETYRGTAPFSEVETRLVGDLMVGCSQCKMYLSLHSQGRVFLYPYGYTSNLPENWEDIEDVANAGALAIREYSGARYRVGNSHDTLYFSTGKATDYALDKAKIPIPLTMELPGGGSRGFDLPPRNIEAAVKESWAGIRAMFVRVAQKYPLN